jgi:hypothetical protein
MRHFDRKSDGTFQRNHEIWMPDRWDDGWIDNKGRFRVYRPDCPRAFKSGYALRAHVVWWLRTGMCHPVNTNLHHLNEIRLDDHFENLQVLAHGEHTRLHHKKHGIDLTCLNCGELFNVPEWRIRHRDTRYCSQKCFHGMPSDPEKGIKISLGLKKAYAEGRR